MKAVAIGQQYIDFGMETPEGEVLKVSDVHNESVLLIDFWASWVKAIADNNLTWSLISDLKYWNSEGAELREAVESLL